MQSSPNGYSLASKQGKHPATNEEEPEEEPEGSDDVPIVKQEDNGGDTIFSQTTAAFALNFAKGNERAITALEREFAAMKDENRQLRGILEKHEQKHMSLQGEIVDLRNQLIVRDRAEEQRKEVEEAIRQQLDDMKRHGQTFSYHGFSGPLKLPG
ncbi:hypothetical protein HDU96_001806 [Phlyctochytrium bullatum]|nr:hypothetical protein HDU96_001806 [Phlyctochytrium bullatum]